MMLSGIDISNLQSAPTVYRGQQWYADAQFVIVQAIPRPAPNGLAGAQLEAAQADGKYVGVYSWLWHTPSWRLNPDVGEDQRLRLATVPDDCRLDMRVWLDVEDDQSDSWSASGLQQRKDDVLYTMDALDKWSSARGLPLAGIYTSGYFIDRLFDGWMPAGVKLWLAHYGVQPGSLIKGDVVAHQYTSTPIDQDVMLESEIVSREEPVPDVDQAWQDRKAEIVGLAGELRTVADQIRAAANRKYGPVRSEVLPLADAVRGRVDQILGG